MSNRFVYSKQIRYSLMNYFGLFAPYFDLCCFLPSTPVVSRMPWTMWYRTPGKSFTRPPRIKTTECSWSACPSPGIYAVTSMPFVSRTRATFRSAEFGFLGVIVVTLMHTPRLNGDAYGTGRFSKTIKHLPKAGDFDLYARNFLPCLIS